MSKIDYYVWKDDDYVDLEVYFSVRQREWRMKMFKYKDELKGTQGIARPSYEYAPTPKDDFEEVTRLPKRVKDYFDSVMDKAKAILILEQFQ